MNKKNYVVFIRNQETEELKQVNKISCTVDEAIDKVMDQLESPWKIAKFETIEYYRK